MDFGLEVFSDEATSLIDKVLKHALIYLNSQSRSITRLPAHAKENEQIRFKSTFKPDLIRAV